MSDRNSILNILLGILLSLWLHATMFLILSFFAIDLFQVPDNTIQKSFPITKWDVKEKIPEKLIKIKTVGIEQGGPDISFPINQETSRPISGRLNPPLSALAPTPLKKSSNTFSAKTLSSKIDNIQKKDPHNNNDSVKRDLMTEFLNDLGPTNSDLIKPLSYSNLNFTFKPPKGMREDELNSMEKIFYGFHKRTFENYVNSFINSLNQIVLERPYLRYADNIGTHDLSGRIIFNKKGIVLSTKFLQQSANQDVERLFENTLMGIRSIPNPPTPMLEADGTFTVYYRLKITN